jgi:hypothetical protein
MLYAVGFDHFNMISDLDREMHPVHGIALLDLLKHPLVPFCKYGGFVKAFFHGGEKAVFWLS